MARVDRVRRSPPGASVRVAKEARTRPFWPHRALEGHEPVHVVGALQEAHVRVAGPEGGGPVLGNAPGVVGEEGTGAAGVQGGAQLFARQRPDVARAVPAPGLDLVAPARVQHELRGHAPRGVLALGHQAAQPPLSEVGELAVELQHALARGHALGEAEGAVLADEGGGGHDLEGAGQGREVARGRLAQVGAGGEPPRWARRGRPAPPPSGTRGSTAACGARASAARAGLRRPRSRPASRPRRARGRGACAASGLRLTVNTESWCGSTVTVRAGAGLWPRPRARRV